MYHDCDVLTTNYLYFLYFIYIFFLFFFIFFFFFLFFFFFFFNDTATTEIYTLSLHDALSIYPLDQRIGAKLCSEQVIQFDECLRSEEHTSELQSRSDLVCRLLLEKKKKNNIKIKNK